MSATAKGEQQSRFDSYSVRNSELIISHITFRDCRLHIFSDNLSRNSCMYFGVQVMQMSSLELSRTPPRMKARLHQTTTWWQLRKTQFSAS